jgi:hypothetical protein
MCPSCNQRIHYLQIVELEAEGDCQARDDTERRRRKLIDFNSEIAVLFCILWILLPVFNINSNYRYDNDHHKGVDQAEHYKIAEFHVVLVVGLEAPLVI